MKLPDRIPPDQPWGETDQTRNNKPTHLEILAVRAIMIENMDENIGRMIKFLKDTGQYDNTLIYLCCR